MRIRCSTPFGVMDGFTSLRPGRSSRRTMCSTPFGVMDGFTEAVLFLGAGAGVLNAFRRHGWFHLPNGDWSRPATSAQRLSASWMVSPAASTRKSSRNPVLNAFRRHGWFHFATAFAVIGFIVRAQRLSASWMVSPEIPRHRWGKQRCAQRLSASWMVSRGRRKALFDITLPDLLSCTVY